MMMLLLLFCFVVYVLSTDLFVLCSWLSNDFMRSKRKQVSDSCYQSFDLVFTTKSTTNNDEECRRLSWTLEEEHQKAIKIGCVLTVSDCCCCSSTWQTQSGTAQGKTHEMTEEKNFMPTICWWRGILPTVDDQTLSDVERYHSIF
jgi:hypothetical protein